MTIRDLMLTLDDDLDLIEVVTLVNGHRYRPERVEIVSIMPHDGGYGERSLVELTLENDRLVYLDWSSIVAITCKPSAQSVP